MNGKIIIENGHFLPFQGIAEGEVLPPNPQSHTSPSELFSAQDAHAQLAWYLGRGWEKSFVSSDQLADLHGSMLEQISGSELAELNSGTLVALPLPKIQVYDYGETLQDLLLPALFQSLEVNFPGRGFCQCRAPHLRHKVNMHRTRHEKTLGRMAQGPSVALVAPYAAQGWGPRAAMNLEQALPKQYALSGGIDTMLLLIAYGDKLLKSADCPVMDWAGVYWEKPQRTIYVIPDEVMTTLHFGMQSPDENFSPPVLYFG